MLRIWVTVCILIGLLGACTAPRFDNSLVNRLSKRGLVTLSPDNQYLAGNLLINREAEKYPELQGFLAQMGYPAAMEVEHSYLEGLRLIFYYPERAESYSLDSGDATLIIEGPQPISSEKRAALAQLGLNSAGTAWPLTPDFEIPAATETTAVPATDAPKSFKSVGPSTPPEILGNGLGQDLDGEPAEMTPRGDLVHYVTYPGETLIMIVRWYTYDVENAGRIARINNLTDANRLKLGDSIVIPNYLVRNRNRLTANVVRALSLQ